MGTRQVLGPVSQPRPLTALDYGAKAWSLDPAYAIAAALLTAGNLYYVMCKMPATDFISNVSVAITTGATTPTYAALALYDKSGNQLGVSADQSASWISTGIKVVPLIAPTPVLPAGTLFWVALETVGGTGMTVRDMTAGGGVNTGLTAGGGLRVGVNVGGATNPIPTTLVQSAATAGTVIPLLLFS